MMIRKLLVSIAIVLMGSFAAVAEGDRADDATAMVERAVAYYQANGLEALVDAVHDPDNTDFHDAELYVFIYDLDGINVALGSNPAMVGKDLSGLRDANDVMILQEFIKTVTTDGSGWVDYDWPNPETKQIQAKSSYVTKLGDAHLVGVGIYK